MSFIQRTYSTVFKDKLSTRESEILRLVVRSFIDTAGPIGSRFFSPKLSCRFKSRIYP